MEIPRPVLAKSLELIDQTTKRDGLEYLIDALIALPDNQGLGPWRRMLKELSNWSSFAEANDPLAASQAVEQFRTLIQSHDGKIAERERQSQAEKEKREKEHQERQRSQIMTQRIFQLGELRDRYQALFASHDNPQKRGLELERVLHELFKFEDLNPERAFTLQGEQIDGAFELAGTHFLVEAKWHKDKIGPDQVVWLKDKVSEKYKNTTGLLISISGFTEYAIKRAADSKSIILMDGYDLYQVLDPNVDLDLKELLRQKIKAFSLRGNPYLTAQDILSGRS